MDNSSSARVSKSKTEIILALIISLQNCFVLQFVIFASVEYSDLLDNNLHLNIFKSVAKFHFLMVDFSSALVNIL